MHVPACVENWLLDQFSMSNSCLGCWSEERKAHTFSSSTTNENLPFWHRVSISCKWRRAIYNYVWGEAQVYISALPKWKLSSNAVSWSGVNPLRALVVRKHTHTHTHTESTREFAEPVVVTSVVNFRMRGKFERSWSFFIFCFRLVGVGFSINEFEQINLDLFWVVVHLEKSVAWRDGGSCTVSACSVGDNWWMHRRSRFTCSFQADPCCTNKNSPDEKIWFFKKRQKETWFGLQGRIPG